MALSKENYSPAFCNTWEFWNQTLFNPHIYILVQLFIMVVICLDMFTVSTLLEVSLSDQSSAIFLCMFATGSQFLENCYILPTLQQSWQASRAFVIHASGQHAKTV